MQPDETRQVNSDQRYRTLMIIWGAIFMNVVLFFVVGNVVGPEQAKLPEAHSLDFSLGFSGTLITALSVFLRYKMIERAIERQRPQSVFGAYIISFAMCEAGALCGLMIRLTTNETRYYLLLIIAVAGLLLNMPRRDKILNASSEKQI